MKRCLCLLCALFVSFSWGAPRPSGFFFEKTDHFLTPSEELYFTYEIPAGEEWKGGVEFLITKDGSRIRSGSSTERQKGTEPLIVFRLLEQSAVKQLSSGWHDLAVRPVGTEEFFHQKFFVRNEDFSSRVVYLLDNATPEGFAFWCNEPDDARIEPLRSFPDRGRPDSVVVSSFTPLPEAQLSQLKRFVAEGGTALFFGVNHVQLDELTPLKLDRANLYPDAPEDGRYLLRASLAEGGTVVKKSGNAILIAEKPYGKGRVIAATDGIKPGELYREMLAHGLGIQSATAVRALPINPDADKDGFRTGISRNNFGRFGYLVNDRTNELGIRPEQTFRMWDVEQDYFGVSFSGDHTPGTLTATTTNWLGKQLRATGGRWGEKTDIVWGLGTPGVLFRNSAAVKLSFESPMLGTVAFPVKGGTRVVSLEGKETLDLSELASNWMLLWKRTDRFDAWPLLISFNSRIKKAEMKSGRLELSFHRPGVDFSVMPLAGIKHYTPGETRLWETALPTELAARCARWNRILSARTVDCVERYKLDSDQTNVAIRNEFSYLVIPNDWGVEPEFISFLPPLLPLYRATGFAQLAADAVDLDFATFHGPLWGAPGKCTEYTLTVPDLEYPLPVATVDPKLESPANKALFERICEHLNVPKLIYLGPNYSIVERDPKRIYPERELREVTAKSSAEAAEWRYIDLHRTLGGVTGNLMFKPFLDGAAGYDKEREQLNTKILRNIRRDINFFQYKTFLRYRQEPGTGAKYLMAFLAPVRYNDGYWMFHDMNETAGIFAQTLGLYSRIIGDREFFENNEPFLDAFMSNYFVSNDWSWMASCAVEWGMGNNIDMLNAELPGWAGLAQLKRALGRDAEADFARYMAAKTGVSTGARLMMTNFYNSLNFPIPPHLAPVIHEMSDVQQEKMKRNNYLPLGVSQGYGEGWPSLWPTSISKGLLKHYIDGKDFYSSSKGVPPELLVFYRSSEELAAPLRRYEEQFRAAASQNKAPYLYSRIAGNAFLKDNRADLENMLYRTMRMPDCSARNLGAGVADWETSAMVILLDLLRRSAATDPHAGTVPAGDERGGKFTWETADSGRSEFRMISGDAEPENVVDGAVSVRIDFPAATAGKQPVIFTRFDREAVTRNGCRALSFQLRTEQPGSLEIALPNHNWSKRMSTLLKLDDTNRNWTRVRLEFDRDLKTNGMTTAELRGELFLFNRGEEPLTVYLDDVRLEP